jgi:arabinose-5-phosphate isomerase
MTKSSSHKKQAHDPAQTNDLKADQSLNQDLDRAKRVLGNEASALLALAGSLDETFSQALDIFSAVTGRVVVTGMGKSGHIAAKIAASMASTGTPAMFVHPGEASHGDLGMITRQDAIFALSNSGETSELTNLVVYAKRFNIPLVGMTGKPDSALAREATVALIYPIVGEACPMGLAPTTSTTMMLGLGDAITVALLERKDFSPDDFEVFHPGGKLGRQLLKVEELMHTGAALPLVQQSTPLADVIMEMTKKSFGCAGIVDDDGVLMGIVTDGDLRRAFADPDLTMPACELMTKAPKTIPRLMLAGEAVAIMNGNAITTLFIVKDEKPIGIIHLHDCLRAGVA